MDYSSTLFIQKKKKESGQTYPNEDKDENRDKVVSSGDRVFIRQAEEVHDGGTHAQYALDLVSRRLVCIDGPDLGLSGGPRGLLQVHLQSEDKKKKTQAVTFSDFLNVCVATSLFALVMMREEKKKTPPLGLEELCDWPSQPSRAAGCVRRKACVRQSNSVHENRGMHSRPNQHQSIEILKTPFLSW